MKSALISPLLAGLLLLTGCAQPAAQAGGGGGGTIDAINHTKWAINHFSINGQSGIDIISTSTTLKLPQDFSANIICCSNLSTNGLM